jgi:putative ABC transport system permease protein
MRRSIAISFSGFKRNKTSFIVNVTGLSTGIAAFLMVISFLDFEWSFDAFHNDTDQLYRVVNEFKYEEGVDYQVGAPFPFGDALKTDYPQLKGVTMVFWKNDNQIAVLEAGNQNTEKQFNEKMVTMLQPGFFDMFSFKWLDGSPVRSLTEPDKVVLSRSYAEKYFGDYHKAVGRFLKLDNRVLLQVSGVLEDPPANTDFQLHCVLSYNTLKSFNEVNLQDWQSVWKASQCFIKLPPHADEATFNRNFVAFLKNHQPMDVNHTYMLQKLEDIHSGTHYPPFSERGVSRNTITALIIVAIFLLILPSVNFINMQTAQAISRSKEIGIYKVLGSSKMQLIVKFIKETFFTVLIAVFIAVLLVVLLFRVVNSNGNNFSGFHLMHVQHLLLVLLLMITIVTLLSGVYPALVLSNFNPTLALKGKD